MKTNGMQKFEGTEKQTKWANDIVERTQKNFEDEIKQAESDAYANKDAVEIYKNLTGIITNVLSNLSSVWSARDVIENRAGLERMDFETFGVRSWGGGRRIKVGDASYEGSDLKDSKVRKELENSVFEYLRSHKTN